MSRLRRVFLSEGELTEGGICQLSPEESHHFLHVLRGKEGDLITLFTGDGKEAKGVCVEKKRSSALFKIESVQEVSRELPYLLSVNIVFPKGKHLEDMVDGLTQLGVSRIVPVISDRASWKVDATRIKRLKRTVAESCKQCGRNILPKITEPVSLQESLEMAKGVKLFFDTGATETMAQASLNITPGSDVNGWIGPEGGWSDRELELFNGDEDAKMLSLSPAVLRTETAALSFVSQLFARSGEKG